MPAAVPLFTHMPPPPGFRPAPQPHAPQPHVNRVIAPSPSMQHSAVVTPAYAPTDFKAQVQTPQRNLPPRNAAREREIFGLPKEGAVEKYDNAKGAFVFVLLVCVPHLTHTCVFSLFFPLPLSSSGQGQFHSQTDRSVH
jgi:hypothetical protein